MAVLAQQRRAQFDFFNREWTRIKGNDHSAA
jgi:hypothetical protein